MDSAFPAVISLASGYGNFPVPPAAREQGAQALAADPLPVSPTAGLPELREAIAARLRQRGSTVAAGQVVVTPGAKPALFAVLSGLLRPGDEVLLPTPNWFGF